ELLRRGLVQRVRVDVFQASATGADQRDLRIERTALTREHLEELVRIAVREARQVGARRLGAGPRRRRAPAPARRPPASGPSRPSVTSKSRTSTVTVSPDVSIVPFTSSWAPI